MSRLSDEISSLTDERRARLKERLGELIDRQASILGEPVGERPEPYRDSDLTQRPGEPVEPKNEPGSTTSPERKRDYSPASQEWSALGFITRPDGTNLAYRQSKSGEIVYYPPSVAVPLRLSDPEPQVQERILYDQNENVARVVPRRTEPPLDARQIFTDNINRLWPLHNQDRLFGGSLVSLAYSDEHLKNLRATTSAVAIALSAGESHADLYRTTVAAIRQLPNLTNERLAEALRELAKLSDEELAELRYSLLKVIDVVAHKSDRH